MKYKLFHSLSLISLLSLGSCVSLLDQYPKNGPSTSNFYSNEAELTIAANAVYNTLYWMSNQDVQYQLYLDGATDQVYIRGTYAGMDVIQAGQANSQTGVFGTIWSHFYTRIARANNLLDNMLRAKDAVSQEFYDQIRAQVLTLRAYNYSYLVFLFGDVPYIDHFLSWDAPQVHRTRREVIIGHLYEDLDWAAEHLPAVWDPANRGRVTSGFALGLKARIALYNGDYAEAAEAAGKVIAAKTYSIHPDYGQLFTHKGKLSPEIILSVQYLTNVQVNANAKYIGTRLSNGYSIIVPTQNLVDTYQCRDGLRIDKSPLYNPLKPYENRDPRLRQTILVPGDWHNNYRFEVNPDSLKTTAIIDGKETRVGNTEVTNAYGTFTGYVGRKYFDEADLPEYISKSELPFILMRYPEILLTYAEARLELGEADQSVVDAINGVRCRNNGMPPVSLSDGLASLKETVRYERSVEFAMEGLRLFDIRRWKTAEHLMTGNLIGKRQKGHWTDAVVPSFDEYGRVAYPDEDIFTILRKMTFDPSKDYLWPIPQDEIDKNPLLLEEPTDKEILP